MTDHGVVIFLHGLESGPAGLKIEKMRATANSVGWQTQAPDGRFSRDPLRRSEAVLAQWPHQARRVYLVGSSLGGFVAAAVAATLAQRQGNQAQPMSHYPANLRGLLLLCPAFDLPGYPLDRPLQALPGEAIQLVHGSKDTVVPLSHSQRAARDWGADLRVCEDDHSLHASIETICELLEQRLALAEQSV